MTQEEKDLMNDIWDSCKEKTSTLRQQYQMAMNEYVIQKSTIDRLKLIATLAKFQEQKRVAMDILVNVQQLIVGWKGTVTKEEWSAFDEKTLQELTKLMTDIHNSLPSVGAK